MGVVSLGLSVADVVADGSMYWFVPESCGLLGVVRERERLFVVWASGLAGSGSGGSGISPSLRSCARSSVRRASLPLPSWLTDPDMEFHRPRGAFGSLFEELAALYEYFAGGVASPEAYASFRRPLAMVFAISSVAQWLSYLWMIGILGSL